MKFGPLKDLNDLRRNDELGIYKQWIYKDTYLYHLMCDYLQKINYSIQDLNDELISDNFELDEKTIVYLICLIDWINEPLDLIKKILKETVYEDIYIHNKSAFSKDIELENNRHYFEAIRSFVVAHPLRTDRHKKFNLDGDYICADIFGEKRTYPIISLKNTHQELFRYMDLDGMHEGFKESDFYLQAYSTKANGNKYSLYIGVDLTDILEFARLSIKKIYELDDYLSKFKKKDFITSNECK